MFLSHHLSQFLFLKFVPPLIFVLLVVSLVILVIWVNCILKGRGMSKLQRGIFDYIEGDDEPDFEIGKAVRNATFHMIQKTLPEKRRLVYEVILENPGGVTRKQIAKILGWPINCVTGRVTELRDKHHLIKEVSTVSSPCYDGRMYPNGVLRPI